jgi:DNA-binding NarL/FixJ family response regulator
MTDQPVDRPLRMLIVDDHAVFRRGIREVLNEEEDMQVVAEALGGEQAIQMVRDLRPDGLDLILMDIDMPGLDGIATTERIAAEHPNLPVVMMTVSTLDRDLFEAVRVGAVGFLSKSLSPDALVRALRGFRRGESLPMSPALAQKVLGYFKGVPTASPQPVNMTPSALIEPQLAETGLTSREQEVLELIAQGARDREIAERLIVTESTVKKHVQNILRKLHARNRVEAVAHLRGGGFAPPSAAA